METVTDQDDEQRAEEGPSDGTEFSDDSEDATGTPRKLRKRRKPRYNAAYQELLHNTCEEISSGGVEVNEPVLQPSQLGLTLWSSEEKEVLFTVLSTKGKDDLKAIAEAIGSKSEPEVHVYLQLLQQMTENQRTSGSDSGMVDFTEVPAAFEISEACTTVLDAAADAMLVKERELAEEKGREYFGDFWLLDASLAEGKDNSAEASGPSQEMSEHPQLQYALELLKLDNWLHLSSRIFMNPRDLTDNWRCYADKGETPSIHASAFIDFHNLAVIVTKRLVSSAIFFAKSRLRVTKTRKHGHQHRVRQEDIMAAVDVLGMEPDAVKFWYGAARRCRLDVHETVTVKKCSGQYSLEEIEGILMQPGGKASSVPTSPSGEHVLLSESEGMFAGNSEGQTDDEVSDAIGTRADGDAELTTRAEALDQQVSREEEQHLWSLFPQTVKRPLQTDHTRDELPKRQRISIPSEDTSSDWRDFMDYQTPWQRHRTPVPPANFIKNRKLYREKPALTPLGDMKQFSEHSHALEEQDEASPLENGSSDGVVDDLKPDIERAQAEYEAHTSDTEGQDEEGPLSSPDDTRNETPSPVHYHYEIDGADSEGDTPHHRGRSD